jgi:hypothetical protein
MDKKNLLVCARTPSSKSANEDVFSPGEVTVVMFINQWKKSILNLEFVVVRRFES